jgi:hypothetical protein
MTIPSNEGFEVLEAFRRAAEIDLDDGLPVPEAVLPAEAFEACRKEVEPAVRARQAADEVTMRIIIR